MSSLLRLQTWREWDRKVKAWRPHWPAAERKLRKAGLVPFTPKGARLVCWAFIPSMALGAAGEWMLNGYSPNLMGYGSAILFLDAWLMLMAVGFDWTTTQGIK